MNEPSLTVQTFEGSTRKVLVTGGLAVKFARDALGMRCNLEEARLWRRYERHPQRGPILCPVLWCASDGLVLVMEAADPLGADNEGWRGAADTWGYTAGADDGCPFEPKAANWGTLRDGRLVAIDYALLVMGATDEQVMAAYRAEGICDAV